MDALSNMLTGAALPRQTTVNEQAHDGGVGNIPPVMEVNAPAAQAVVMDSSVQNAMAVLKSLAPVFKAAMIYPGHDADPVRLAAAIKLMSQTAVDLTAFIISTGHVTFDTNSPKKTIQAFAVDLVANRWIAAVMRQGGVAAGELPDVAIDYFKPAIQTAITLTKSLKAADGEEHSSLPHLALMTSMAPVVLEVSRFATFVNSSIPGMPVSEEGLVSRLGQFVIDQAGQQQQRFAEHIGELSVAGQQELRCALIRHAAESTQVAWEYCRGNVLGALRDAGDATQAAQVMQHPAYVLGFPLTELMDRAAELFKRLAGTAMHAVALLNQKASPGECQ
jgi:hypothetical protein